MEDDADVPGAGTIPGEPLIQREQLKGVDNFGVTGIEKGHLGRGNNILVTVSKPLKMMN